MYMDEHEKKNDETSKKKIKNLTTVFPRIKGTFK